MNPLSTTLGVTNVSFVAQAVDWIPDMFYDILARGFHHKGLAFIRVLQRCPNYLPDIFDPWIQDPTKTRLLTHEKGLQIDPSLSRTFKNQVVHDPSDINAAREYASEIDPIPVGILYHNPDVPCYEDVRAPTQTFTPEKIEDALNMEMDKFTIEPAVKRNEQ